MADGYPVSPISDSPTTTTTTTATATAGGCVLSLSVSLISTQPMGEESVEMSSAPNWYHHATAIELATRQSARIIAIKPAAVSGQIDQILISIAEAKASL